MERLLKYLAKQYMRLEMFLRKHMKATLISFAIFFFFCVIGMVTVLSGATAPSKKIIVAIDPGHGGNDPGKVGSLGSLEKDINLSIALKLRDKLMEEGCQVVITRCEDTNLATPGAQNKKSSDMSNRVELINDSGADVLISIHQNSYSDSNVKGTQVFYYGGSDESRMLAEKLQKSFIENVDTSNHRKAKEGNDYYILRKTSCPGVIIECGFLSCPEEESKLMDDGYQNKIVDAIAEVILEMY